MNKLINLVHKLEGASETDIQNLMSWIQAKAPKAVSIFATAHKITQAFITEAQSPTGHTVETIIASIVPETNVVFPTILALAQKLATATQKVADDLPAIEGIALRYGSEIVSAIDGNKKTIDEYILDYQQMFTSSIAK